MSTCEHVQTVDRKHPVGRRGPAASRTGVRHVAVRVRVVGWSLHGLFAAAALLAAFLWSYAPTLRELLEFWHRNDDYSAGQLVPLATLGLLWREWRNARLADSQPCAAGLLLVLFSQAVRFAALYYGYGSAERYSMVLLVAGMVWTTAGPRVLSRLAAVLAFLLLMVPLPQRLHLLIASPLQSAATVLGVAGLELLGYYVRADGNVLHVNDTSTLLVAEACSGLRMLTAFVFTVALLCFFVRRSAWQKAILLASSLPIAVAVNGLRVVVTAVLVDRFSSAAIERWSHDMAGLFMMPLAIAIVLAELRLLSLLGGPQSAPRPPAVVRVAGPPLTRRHLVFHWSAVSAVSVVLLASGWGHRALAEQIGAALRQVATLRAPLAELPLQLGDWVGRDVPIDENIRRVPNFDDDFVNRTYSNPRRHATVGVFIGYVGRPRAWLGHRPDVCFASHGWKTVAQQGTVVQAADGSSVPGVIYEFEHPTGLGERALALGTYMVNGRFSSEAAALRGYNARRPNWNGDTPAYLLRIQVWIRTNGDRAGDEAVLRDFTAQVVEPTAALMPYRAP